MNYPKERLTRKILKLITGIKEDLKTEKGINQYQTIKLKKKVKDAYKTPYWQEIIDNIAREKNTTAQDLISKIKTIDDFKLIIPETTREELTIHGKEMTTKPLEKLIEMHTSGTSTNKPVTAYSTSLDMAVTTLAIAKTYIKAGLDQFSHVIVIFPRESSIWNANGKSQRVLPNMEFMDLNTLDESGIIKILQADGLQSYTNIPVQIFNKYQKTIEEYIKKGGEVKLKAIFGGGDFLAPSAVKRIQEILKKEINEYNSLITIEASGISYVCKNNNIHLSSELYFTEIKNTPEEPNTGELLFTSLYAKGMHFFRYHTGDLVEKIKCECNSPDTAIKMLGRTYSGEIHKHIRTEQMQNIIYNSKPFKEGKINGKGNIIYTMGEEKPIIEVQLAQGSQYKIEEKEKIIQELYDTIKQSDEYALKIGTAGTWTIWDLKFNIIPEINSSKWKEVIMK